MESSKSRQLWPLTISALSKKKEKKCLIWFTTGQKHSMNGNRILVNGKGNSLSKVKKLPMLSFHFQTQLEHGLLWNHSNTPWNKWTQNAFAYQQQVLFWRKEGSFYWNQGQSLKGTDVEFYVLSPKLYYSITNFVCTIF